MPFVVELPENYVAFVLPDTTQAPSPQELEKLRLGTIHYLQWKLKSHYPSLQELKLNFLSSEFGTGQPAPKFNLYLQARATVHFGGHNNTDEPEKNDVFEKYVSSFTEEYLAKAIRKLSVPSLEDAIEVRARRLGEGTPGGAVTAPRFYMAFVCEDEPTRTPNRDEQDDLVGITHKHFTRLLKEEFEADFKDVVLKVVATEVGEAAGKPEGKFNLYVEFEAVGTFQQNVPEPMDFFRAVSDPPMGFTKEVQQIRGCFDDIGEMVVRCVFVETPVGLVPAGDAEEEEEEGAAGEGEMDEKEKKKPDRLVVKVELGFYVALVIRVLEAIPKADQMDDFDQLMKEFFSDTLKEAFKPKFVDLTLEPSPQFQAGIPLPRFNMVHQYDATIHFYHPPPEGTEVLQKILYCNLSDLYAKINGLCAPYNDMAEFTMGRALEKQATDKAYGGKLGLEEKRRREAEEKAKKEAEEAARKKAAEEKARKEAAEKKRKEEEAARKQAAEEKAKKDAAEKAAAEKKRKEEEAARKKAAEEKAKKEAAAVAEKKRKEEEAARKAAEEKKRKEDAAKALAEKKRKEEEAARREAEERAKKEKERQEAEARAKAAKEAKQREEAEKKRKEEAARKAKEEAERLAEEERRKEAKIEVIDDEPTVPVGTANVFMAFTMPKCKAEPTQRHYEALSASTEKYYAKHLKKKWKTFRRVKVSVRQAYFRQDKPDPSYNVYVEYDIAVNFAEAGGKVPDRYELCTSLVHIDLGGYISKGLWTLHGTPFQTARGVFTEQINSSA